jgi:hypothetical protein
MLSLDARLQLTAGARASPQQCQSQSPHSFRPRSVVDLRSRMHPFPALVLPYCSPTSCSVHPTVHDHTLPSRRNVASSMENALDCRGGVSIAGCWLPGGGRTAVQVRPCCHEGGGLPFVL